MRCPNVKFISCNSSAQPEAELILHERIKATNQPPNGNNSMQRKPAVTASFAAFCVFPSTSAARIIANPPVKKAKAIIQPPIYGPTFETAPSHILFSLI